MNIAPKLTAQLDASKHIISDWRNFFRFRSIQWSLGGFVIAFINSVVLAAGAIPFKDAVGGLVMWGHGRAGVSGQHVFAPACAAQVACHA